MSRILTHVNNCTVDALIGDEIQEFRSKLSAHKNPVFLDIFNVGIQLALRISDLLSLQFKDLIIDGEVVDKIYIREGKTSKVSNKRPRMITLNNKAKEVILRRYKQYPESVFLFQSTSRNAKKSSPVTRDAVSKVFKPLGDEMGKKINTHSLRKTKGRYLYDSGVRVEMICKMLNHSSPSITMRYLGITNAEIESCYDLEL